MKKVCMLFYLAIFILFASCAVNETPTDSSNTNDSQNSISDDEMSDNSNSGSDSEISDETNDDNETTDNGGWEDHTCYERTGDADGDGIPNSEECPEFPCVDNDGDDLPDCLDTDADGDTISDAVECGEGEGCADTDGDETPDYLDRDSDNDGLPDKKEKDQGTDPLLKDTDGDGSDDLAEIAYGSDPLDDNDTIPAGIFYVVLPYKAPDDVTRTLTFSTKIDAIDIQIILDISGSMSDEIEEVKDGIKTNIIDKIKAEFTSPEYASYGISRISWGGTSTFMRQKQTFDADEVKDAVDVIANDAAAMKVGINELHSEVLYQLAAGEAFIGTATLCAPIVGCMTQYDAAINIDKADCSNSLGEVGHACFRKKSMPIYILITDEEHVDCDPDGVLADSECFWHNQYPDQMNGHTLDEAIAVMNGIGTKFIGINTWHEKTADGENNAGIDPQTDMEYLAMRTGSIDGNGDPFIYHTSTPTGEGMPEQIGQAIIDLTSWIDMDVTTGKLSDEDCNGQTAADFVRSSKTIEADPPEGVSGQNETTFFSVTQGTDVTFDVRFYNDFCINSGDTYMEFNAEVTVLGNGSFLSSRLVHVIVPETANK